MLACIENERNQNESKQVLWQAGVAFIEQRSGAVIENEVREFFFFLI